jgi:hypothetical protein
LKRASPIRRRASSAAVRRRPRHRSALTVPISIEPLEALIASYLRVATALESGAGSASWPPQRRARFLACRAPP